MSPPVHSREKELAAVCYATIARCCILLMLALRSSDSGGPQMPRCTRLTPIPITSCSCAHAGVSLMLAWINIPVVLSGLLDSLILLTMFLGF
jgi:hypothetical protein